MTRTQHQDISSRHSNKIDLYPSTAFPSIYHIDQHSPSLTSQPFKPALQHRRAYTHPLEAAYLPTARDRSQIRHLEAVAEFKSATSQRCSTRQTNQTVRITTVLSIFVHASAPSLRGCLVGRASPEDPSGRIWMESCLVFTERICSGCEMRVQRADKGWDGMGDSTSDRAAM